VSVSTSDSEYPALDQTMPKAMKNICGMSHLQQRKMSPKVTKGKKPVKANPKLLTTMMHTNPKFQMGKPMLIVDALREAGKSCVELYKYYINNYKKNVKT
jgi:hypothetical protein